MPVSADITLITIDLDDTVWPCAPVIQAAEAALLDWLGRRAGRLAAAHDAKSLREHWQALARRRPELAHDITALRVTSLRAVLEEHGYGGHLAEEAMAVFLEARQCVTPYPDVAPVLAALRERCTLGSLTNGNADVWRSPLGVHFDFALSAAEVGASKPDPAMFRAAQARAGARPGQALHVGDDPELDVEAARQAGMRAVWMNRAGLPWPDTLPPPEVEVRDFHELAARLEGPAA
jgi:2-haloalkanoic acid dehalogenase type II